MDAYPGFSQLKSGVQFAFGDFKGAWQTQINFTRQCPVISQARSAIEVAAGDPDAALETQIECAKFLSRTVDAVPVVGHLKGFVHRAVGDEDGYVAAQKSATRSAAIAAYSAIGFVAGGPAGAAFGGIGMAAQYDFTVSCIDSENKGEFSPYGMFEFLEDPKDPGKCCDSAWKVPRLCRK
ncbi:uncharacterized protein LOC108679916 [Hyalella azteca]|uniref:Uncharacterized protein LOC108679916 n=1 Tax=Hyalella azteca TaxID=294128 RepID=A0A8B7PDH5_HYAAZ|nr:uncharacterized protein LOC108679916 [Hyalella azteca]